jgi:hypothetical protein
MLRQSEIGHPESSAENPFKFTGKIDKRTIAINRPKITPEDEKRLIRARRVRLTRGSSITCAADIYR